MRHLQYHPVIELPKNYEVYDFSQGYNSGRTLSSPFGIGRYDEKRPGMYNQDLFIKNHRNIHMGIDIGCPVSTPVHAFSDGEVFRFANNPGPGDYGYTLITLHQIDGKPLYALHGHLSAASVGGKRPGQKIRKGEVIAWVGDRHENGGWNSHLHFQISWQEPAGCDMPGVVSEENRERAKQVYPDPRLVLGPLY
jgi:murein DD-endopeptidase MepM/ murein hydrolase activator NlpD